MNLSRLSSTLLAASLMLAPTASFASENPGAHQHGHAELQLAIEGERVDLIFTSPAYNLLGFEHRARTGEQAALVTTTTHWLTTTPLVSTTSGGCSVASASVHHQADPEDHGHHSDGDHGHQSASSHSDFEVAQTLDCPGLDGAGALSTPITERFPEINQLDVEWVWSGSQGGTALNQDQQVFGPDVR